MVLPTGPDAIPPVPRRYATAELEMQVVQQAIAEVDRPRLPELPHQDSGANCRGQLPLSRRECRIQIRKLRTQARLTDRVIVCHSRECTPESWIG
jgi:hypothetical protein